MRLRLRRAGAVRLALLLAVAVLLTACAQAARPSAREAEDGRPGRTIDVGDAGAYRLLNVNEFREMLADGAPLYLVNVHIPYEGEIEGTDAHVPYNDIASHMDLLPADRSARLVLYCRSGPMSRMAAEELVDLGYIDLYDVEDGMVAWTRAGEEIVILR